MSEESDRVGYDVPENAGVPRGEGESWGELAERLQEERERETEEYADVSEAFSPCPVCGWGVVRTEGVPENPDPDHGPDSYGMLYVHEIRATGNGRFEVAGCTEYADGETEAWEL